MLIVNKSCKQELSCEQMSSNVTSMSDVAPICLGKTFPVGWLAGWETLRPAAAAALPELGNIFLLGSTNGNQEGTLNY